MIETGIGIADNVHVQDRESESVLHLEIAGGTIIGLGAGAAVLAGSVEEEPEVNCGLEQLNKRNPDYDQTRTIESGLGGNEKGN